MDDEEWCVVTSSKATASAATQRVEESPVALTKQQLKNQRRNARRREQKQQQQPLSPPPAPPPPRHLSDDDEEDVPRVDDDQDELDTMRDLERRIRKLSKSLKGIEAAEEKVVRLGLMDSDIIAKTKRRDDVSRELEATRSLMASVENARSERLRAAAEAARARREETAQIFLSVRFDDRFACPICTEVIEAAVSIPCGHVFCRACLEDHVGKATSKKALSCPLCRADMCAVDEETTTRVCAKPAHSMRNKLKYATGQCHCGETLPLNKLRDHLRQCGPNSHFFAPRRKFGHEFKQPQFLLS